MNSNSFQQWLEVNEDYSNIEQIQALSTSISELHRILREDHEFTLALRHFESWYQTVALILETRNIGAAELQFVEPVGNEWHQQISSFQKAITNWLKSFPGTGRAAEDSGIVLVLKEHLVLAETALQEIKYVRAIENTIMQKEQTWKDEQLGRAREASKEDGGDYPDTTRIGIWNQNGQSSG